VNNYQIILYILYWHKCQCRQVAQHECKFRICSIRCLESCRLDMPINCLRKMEKANLQPRIWKFLLLFQNPVLSQCLFVSRYFVAALFCRCAHIAALFCRALKCRRFYFAKPLGHPVYTGWGIVYAHARNRDF
jgi:hypothetical protein